MEIDITEVVVAMIGVLSVVITSVVVPLIKMKLDKEQWETLMLYTTAGVQAAEILFGSKKGQEKLKYVMDYVEKQCAAHNIKVDTQTIRIAAENAWEALGLGRKEECYGDGE